MANDPPNVDWGKPLDPKMATLVRLAVVLRDGLPEGAAELTELGSRDFSDIQIHAVAGELIRLVGEYAGTTVSVFAMERILANDDPNADFWFRVLHAMAKIGMEEPEPGDLLH